LGSFERILKQEKEMKTFRMWFIMLSILVVILLTSTGIRAANTLTFDSDKIMYLNGTKFFPIGIYNTGANYAADAKQYGFNTIQCYCEQYAVADMNQLMIYAANNGLYVLLGVENGTYGASGQVLDFSNNMSAKQTLINQTVDTFKDRTNLLGFYCGDEPTDNGINATYWGQGADYLRSRDGSRTRVFLTCDRQSELTSTSTYAAKSNVLLEDHYPGFTSSSGSTNGISVVTTYVGYAVAASIGGAGVVSQAFNFPSFVPTEAQLRCQAYLAICAGAKQYYAYAMQNGQGSSPAFYLYDGTHSALIAAHQRLNAQLAKLSPVWLTSSSYNIGTTANNSDIKTYSRNVDSGTGVHDTVYVTAVNQNESTTHNNVTLTMGSPAWIPERLWAIGENRACTVNASKQFTDNFAPYADHQYTSAHSAMHVIDSNGVLWRSLSEGPVGWEQPMASMYNFSSMWPYFTSQYTSVEPLGSGDIDGDGYDDVVVVHTDTWRIDALLMGQTGLKSLVTNLGTFNSTWLPLGVGDVNDEGHAAIVAIDPNGEIWALCTNGSSITHTIDLGNPHKSWGWWFTSDDTTVKPLGIADINGDGYADIVVIGPGADGNDGEIRALTTNGKYITSIVNLGNTHELWGWWLGASWPHEVVPCKIGDVNGDGYADICTVAPDGTCKAVLTNGSAIWTQQTISSPSSLLNSNTTSKLKCLDIPFGWGWLNTD
jgi:hypothetical protein